MSYDETQHEAIVTLDTDARADAFLFTSQVENIHAVLKSAGYDTPYLATRHAADVKEVTDLYAHAAETEDADDREEAYEVAESRLDYWDSLLINAGYASEYLTDTAAWIIYAEEEN